MGKKFYQLDLAFSMRAFRSGGFYTLSGINENVPIGEPYSMVLPEFDLSEDYGNRNPIFFEVHPVVFRDADFNREISFGHSVGNFTIRTGFPGRNDRRFSIPFIPVGQGYLLPIPLNLSFAVLSFNLSVSHWSSGSFRSSSPRRLLVRTK